LSLLFAIPDHPWVDEHLGAAVRVAMTVGAAGTHEGILNLVIGEISTRDGSVDVALRAQQGRIHSNLRIGADLTQLIALKANIGISYPGVKLHGPGFIITKDKAASLGLGSVPGLEHHMRQYSNGKDLTDISRGAMVIDLLGLREEEVMQRFPQVYQHVVSQVRPEREQNRRESYAKLWWLFGEPRRELRPLLERLPRYVATVKTSKHRFFLFLSTEILPDDGLVAVGLSDAFHLGVLSSRVHVVWALAAGGTLESRPRYNKTVCFDPFPFPACEEEQRGTTRQLGEALDAHRKRQQALHPDLTLTGMYNVLAKLRTGEALTAKERTIHEQGLCSVLKQIHDDLDAAVFDAYGWPASLTDEEILERLVALNHERAEEEKRGLVRWLRPDFQNPAGKAAAAEQPTARQGELFEADEPDEAQAAPVAAPATPAAGPKLPWPDSVPEQVQAVRSMLGSMPAPVTVEAMAKRFQRARKDRVRELLDTLVLLGQARKVGEGYGG